MLTAVELGQGPIQRRDWQGLTTGSYTMLPDRGGGQQEEDKIRVQKGWIFEQCR